MPKQPCGGGRSREEDIRAEQALRARAQRETVRSQQGSIPPIMMDMDDAYWTGFSTDRLIQHVQILSGEDETVVTLREGDNGSTELFVSAPDSIGLFARVCAAIASQGASAVSAQVFTTHSGRILDVFVLQDDQGHPYAQKDTRRQQRLEAIVRQALDAETLFSPQLVRPNPRKAAFIVQPRVSISHDASLDYTVIDVSGRDRLGLLTDVGRVLAEAGVSIVSAHVGSYGERVFDAFYVILPAGFDDTQTEALRDQILQVVGGQEPDAPRTPARTLKRASAADSF